MGNFRTYVTCCALAIAIGFSGFTAQAMDQKREYNAKRAECMTYCMRTMKLSADQCAGMVSPDAMSGCFSTFKAKSCALPWGGNTPNGSSTTAFKSPSVTEPDTCVSEERVCANGFLRGRYTNQNCIVEAKKYCALPWGGEIEVGESVTAYISAGADFPATCVSQVRTCRDDLNLDGDAAYAVENCTVHVNDPPKGNQDCAMPWGEAVAHGESKTAYMEGTVTAPATCLSESRTCNDGNMDGSFQYQDCKVVEAPPTTDNTPPVTNPDVGPNGNSLANDIIVNSPGKVTRIQYEQMVEIRGGEWESHSRSVDIPQDGSTITLRDIYIGDDYITKSTPRMGTISINKNGDFGLTIPALSRGRTSSMQDIVYTVTDANGNAATGNISMPSAAATPGRSCALTWGILEDGFSTLAYRYARVESPDVCEVETRTCNDGSLDGSFENQGCVVAEPPPSTKASCKMPWGETISHGDRRAAYKEPSVVSPATCETEDRACDDGTLSGSYQYQTCGVTAPVPTPPVTNPDTAVDGNVLDNDIIPNGSGRVTSVTYFKMVQSPYGGEEWDSIKETVEIPQDGSIKQITKIDVGDDAQRSPAEGTLFMDMYGNYRAKVSKALKGGRLPELSADYKVVDAKNLSAKGVIEINNFVMTAQFSSNTVIHSTNGSMGDIATWTLTNGGPGSMSGITWVCGGASFHNYQSSKYDGPLNEGSSLTIKCQASASGGYSASTVKVQGQNLETVTFGPK